jgi:hypothetical protein
MLLLLADYFFFIVVALALIAFTMIVFATNIVIAQGDCECNYFLLQF